MSRNTTLDAERRVSPSGGFESAVVRQRRSPVGAITPPYDRRWRTAQPAIIIVAAPAILVVAAQIDRDHDLRIVRHMLNREGVEIGRRHVATLMKRMGIKRRHQTLSPSTYRL